MFHNQDQLPGHTVEEWEQHSDALDVNDDLYGEGACVAYEIDLGFSNNPEQEDSWATGTNFFNGWLEGNGWYGHSAGTGFGIRDMQFARKAPLTQALFDALVQMALDEKIHLEYITHYGINEWHEGVKEGDEDNNFGWYSESYLKERETRNEPKQPQA